jgi:hypothetical protein
VARKNLLVNWKIYRKGFEGPLYTIRANTASTPKLIESSRPLMSEAEGKLYEFPMRVRLLGPARSDTSE